MRPPRDCVGDGDGDGGDDGGDYGRWCWAAVLISEIAMVMAILSASWMRLRRYNNYFVQIMKSCSIQRQIHRKDVNNDVGNTSKRSGTCRHLDINSHSSSGVSHHICPHLSPPPSSKS